MILSINFWLSQSIAIPIIVTIVVLVRFKKIDKIYYPVLGLFLVGLLTELASLICSRVFKTNAPVIKIYSLIECCILLYQLYLWKKSSKYTRIFASLMIICVAFWVVEVIVFKNINTFSPYFRVFYAFVIILLCINQINSMMFYQKVALIKNPVFIICLSFIVFFLYQIIYEASYFVITDSTSDVPNKIIMGFSYINFFVNIMCAIAVYFMGGSKDDPYSQYFSGRL